MSTTETAAVLAAEDIGLLDRVARRVVTSRLRELRRGQITLSDSGASCRVGESGDLHVSLRVHRPRFFRDAIRGGAMSVAESYLRGDWD